MTTKPTYNHIPALRFPEFQNDGEWKQLKFNDAFSFLQNNTLSRSELNYKTGIAQNIHYGDVLIKYGECVDVKKDVLPFITEDAVAQKYQHAKLQNGDVVIADTAEDEIVGKCSEVIGMTDEFVVSGLHTMPIRPQIPFAQPFLGYYLNSESYRNQLRPLMQGVKVTSLSKSAISKTTIVCPKSIEEQRKIASCLSFLAEMIAATKEKLELLKAYKRGLMQKLFPAQGKTLPEYRFKEFEKDGEWEVKKLGDCLQYEQPQPYLVASENYSSKGTPVLTAGKTFVLGFTTEDFGIFEDVPVIIFDDFTTDSKYVDFPFKAKSSAMKMLHAKEGHNLKFLFETMQTIDFKPMDHQRHWISIYSNFVIATPSYNEQCKIALCFSSIDVAINACASKIVSLQEFKKGLMQQMFPTSK